MHGHNLLHRDIKPANVVWLPDGRTVLIDFGAARLFAAGRTVQHTRILTVEYAAPEQYSSHARFGPYTDLFRLGATLYHAVTGTPPPGAMDRLQGRDIAFPADLEASLQAILQRALALPIAERPLGIGAVKFAGRHASIIANMDAPPLRMVEVRPKEIENARWMSVEIAQQRLARTQAQEAAVKAWWDKDKTADERREVWLAWYWQGHHDLRVLRAAQAAMHVPEVPKGG